MLWTSRVEGGPRRVNHAAVAIEEQNRIYSFGGYCTGDNYQDESIPIDVFVLNVDNLRWSRLSKPARRCDSDESSGTHAGHTDCWPFQRYGHTVVRYATHIFLFGGRNDDSPCQQLYAFDVFSHRWQCLPTTGEAPSGRDGHSACVIGDHMYVYGGYEEVLERFGLHVYRLHLITRHWELLSCQGSPPIYRDFHTATAIGGERMYVFGGRSELQPGGAEYYSNKVVYLDTKELKWVHPRFEKPTVSGLNDAVGAASDGAPCGRRSHSAVNWHNKLLVFAGFNGRSDVHLNDLWLLDPGDESNNLLHKWVRIEPNGKLRPSRRRRQSMCLMGDKLIVFGGTSPYTGPPILFTQQQLHYMTGQVDHLARLIDHNDLFVLDLRPSLKTLCMMHIIDKPHLWQELPSVLRQELRNMTEPNKISKPLETTALPSG